MPTMKKISEEEFRNVGAREKVEREYDFYLSNFGPGEYGCVELEEGEKKPTIRNRLAAAADRRGLVILFIKTKGSVIRFKVEGTHEDAYWPTQPIQIEEVAA